MLHTIVLQQVLVTRPDSKSLKPVPTASSPRVDKGIGYTQLFRYTLSGSYVLRKVAVLGYLA